MNMSRIAALLVCCAVLVGCADAAVGTARSEGAEPAPLAVTTMHVRADATRRTTRVAAITEPVRRSTLATNLMARVVDVHVREGQRIDEGSPIARLDVRGLVARRRQAHALATATSAQAQLAGTGLRRARSLETSGALSTEQRETAEATAMAYDAQMDGTNAAIRELDVNLGESVLRAPFSGVIVQKRTEVGSFAAPGQPLFVLEDDTTLRVLAVIAASDAAHLLVGSTHPITFATGELADGVLDAVTSSGDPRSPGLIAVFLVPNANHRLRTGVVASVQIPAADVGPPTFDVDARAVVDRGGLRGVYVVRRGIAELVLCSVDAQVRDERVIVLDGLREGDVIIVDATLPSLYDGRRVVTRR
jgi:RND family efflux transporter MFP subunit